MKFAIHSLKSIAFAVALCCLATISTAQQAQRTAYAKVPFEFWVGDTRLSAGEYQVKHVISPTLVVFTKKDSRVATEAYLLPVNNEPVSESNAKLVFSVHNGRYSLYEVQGVFGIRRMTADYGEPEPTGDGRVEVSLSYR